MPRLLLVALPLLVLPLASSWLLTSPPHATHRYNCAARSCELRSAEPEPAATVDGTAVPQESPAQLSTPPDSFKVLIDQAAQATADAIADGSLQMEVEFPPLPTSKLDDSSISAYDILEANLRLVTEFHKRLLPKLPSVKKVALTLPDLPERKRAVEFLGDEEPWPGLRAWSLVGGDATPGPFDWVSSVLKQGVAEPELAEWADMYLVLGSTCQARRCRLSHVASRTALSSAGHPELPTLNLLREREPNKPVVYFNLKLDVLRGDLGLPGFPPRGRLLLQYPEGYQTLLDRGKQNYRCVKLTSALKLEDDAAASAISQAGYKQSTWWEDDENNEDVSDDWRK
ncbi:MAG: hypothetical protein SGPRY_008067 [Prymnesium sp.]